jgi:hypothetical protein
MSKNSTLVNEITFLEIIKILNKNKVFILSTVIIFFIISFIYTINRIENYRTHVFFSNPTKIDFADIENYDILLLNEYDLRGKNKKEVEIEQIEQSEKFNIHNSFQKIYYNQFKKNISSGENFILFLNQEKSSENFREWQKLNNKTIENYFFATEKTSNKNSRFGFIESNKGINDMLYIIYPKKILDGPDILNKYALFTQKKTQDELLLYIKNNLKNLILKLEKDLQLAKEIDIKKTFSSNNLNSLTNSSERQFNNIKILEHQILYTKTKLDLLSKENFYLNTLSQKAYYSYKADDISNLYIILIGSFSGFLLSFVVILVKKNIV